MVDWIALLHINKGRSVEDPLKLTKNKFFVVFELRVRARNPQTPPPPTTTHSPPTHHPPMQLNKAFSAPSIARQNTLNNDPLEEKRIFGAQTGGPGRSRINPEEERNYVQTLKVSQEALDNVDKHIRRALKLVETFNEFVATVQRLDAKREAKRQQKKAQEDSMGQDKLWKTSLATSPENQDNHAKLCALLLLQYQAKLDEMFATGHMKKLWEMPGSQAHLFSKSHRDTVSYRPKQEGRGEPSLEFGVFTDISEELRRNITRWEKLNLPAFDVSGPKFVPPPRWLPDIDTAGMQIRTAKKWWGHRGVKFNDIDRDTMAFAKAVAPQGAQRYYTKKSTLDEIHEYRFPFKCTGERFGMDDMSDEDIILLGASGGGATLAAARRRKGSSMSRGGGGGGGGVGGGVGGGDGRGGPSLDVSTLGVTKEDPMDDHDLGLPTDYLRRLEPHERFGTMKSSALKARLKGPSVSFLSKVRRDQPPVYLRKDVFPNVPLGLTPETWTEFYSNSQQMFGKGPSGRERPGIPFVRISATKKSRVPIPENMEEYKRMKAGLPLRKRKRVGVGGGGGGSVVSGGSALLSSSSVSGKFGGSALMSDSITSKAPTMPSRVPGDSMSGVMGGPASDDDDDDMMMEGEEEEDGGEDEMYAKMAAEADVDAHISFEESTTVVDVDSMLAAAAASKKSGSKFSNTSSTSTISHGPGVGGGQRSRSRNSRQSGLGSSQSSRSGLERPSHRRPVGMQVTIQSPAGAYVSLRVTPTTTISELRELVRTKTGLSTKIRAQLESCAVIVFRKHVIDPSKTLQEAGVSNGSTLQALQYW